MRTFANEAVRLGILRIAPEGGRFPGRNGEPGTPVIADVRGALARLDLRRLIVHGLADRLMHDFPTAEIVAGVAKAGVPWGAVIGWHLDLPAAVINLEGPRASGLQRQIEGDVAGRRIVLIDNLSRSGASLRQAAEIVTEAGGNVLGALTVIGTSGSYLGVTMCSLCSMSELLDAALAEGRIDETTIHDMTKEEKMS